MDILISGASTGIGRATAVHLAMRGMTVWAGVRSEKAFADVRKLNVKNLNPVFLDVTDSKSIADAVHEVKKKSGMIHGLINNAGIVVGGPIEGLSGDDWRRQFDTNFFGMIELTRECLPSLRESKGRVVNVSSISGRVASPFLAPYSASKFAMESFSDSLRREVAKHGVKVSIIEPGPIDTPIWNKSSKDGEKLSKDFSAEVMAVYGPSLIKFFKSMEKAGLNAAPVSLVVKAVEDALISNQPRTRYPVGRRIGLISTASGILPDKWLDRLMTMRDRV